MPQCEAHKIHLPTPTYLEYHHVVPQAWQSVWSPVSDGPHVHTMGTRLWDPRTVALCRTGHGNVHWWLSLMMHWCNDNKLSTLPSIKEMLGGLKYVRKEAAIAHLGIERWIAAGGSLSDLFAARQFGAI